MLSMNSRRSTAVIAGLAVLMALTRFHHEGTAFTLADASLAVFFLGGYYLGRTAMFAALLAGAFVIDYLAIAYGGISGFCVSPAYVFLVPTYGVMWIAGRWSARLPGWSVSAVLRICGALFTATTVAFVISNLSFYLLSGRLDHLGWSRYAASLAHDYPGYLGAALMYCIIILGIHGLFASAKAPKAGAVNVR